MNWDWQNESFFAANARRAGRLVREVCASSYFLSGLWDGHRAWKVQEQSRSWRLLNATRDTSVALVARQRGWIARAMETSWLVSTTKELVRAMTLWPLQCLGLTVMVFAACNGLVRAAQNGLGPRGLVLRLAMLAGGLAVARIDLGLEEILSASHFAAFVRWLSAPDPEAGRP
ncbi:MAG: hypothetical protein AB1445_02795 [Bacillota bacterium]